MCSPVKVFKKTPNICIFKLTSLEDVIKGVKWNVRTVVELVSNIYTMRISNFRDLVQIKNLTVMHHVLNEMKNVEWFGITALCAGDLVSYTNLLFYSRNGEISYPQVYTPIIANSIHFMIIVSCGVSF